MSKSIEENIVQTTALIEAKGNQIHSTGTGFKFAVRLSDELALPLLITNKHVVDGATSLTVHFSVAAPEDPLKKVGVITCQLSGGLQDIWIPHPANEVDLGALAIGPIVHKMQEEGMAVYGSAFSEADLPDDEALARLTPIEDILMIGYPIGLHDSVHNQPIVRRGSTATDPRLKFQGRQEFLIDCACWPGSSGSPVLIKTQGLRSEGSSIFLESSRTFLVGALYAGPTHTAAGTVEIKPIPTSNTATVTTKQMIHIGSVINSKRIRELVDAAKIPMKENINIQFHFKYTPIKPE